jgi:hypothetical protein
VTPAFIRRVLDSGGGRLSPEELVSRKIHGAG